jgi:hypothetical protein
LRLQNEQNLRFTFEWPLTFINKGSEISLTDDPPPQLEPRLPPSLWGKVKDSLKDSLIAKGIAVVAFIIGALWISFKTLAYNEFGDVVVDSVIQDLKRGDSKLLLALSDQVASNSGKLSSSLNGSYKQSLNSVYGEMMFGELSLTGDYQFLHVFVPPEQSGILRFRVGNLDPGWVISITASHGVTHWICYSQTGYFPLKKLLDPADGASNPQGAPALPYSDWQYFDNIYTVTFRLAWYTSSDQCTKYYPPPEGTVQPIDSDGKPIAPHPVRLSYIVAVNPPMTSEELKSTLDDAKPH